MTVTVSGIQIEKAAKPGILRAQGLDLGQDRRQLRFDSFAHSSPRRTARFSQAAGMRKCGGDGDDRSCAIIVCMR